MVIYKLIGWKITREANNRRIPVAIKIVTLVVVILSLKYVLKTHFDLTLFDTSYAETEETKETKPSESETVKWWQIAIVTSVVCGVIIVLLYKIMQVSSNVEELSSTFSNKVAEQVNPQITEIQNKVVEQLNSQILEGQNKIIEHVNSHVLNVQMTITDNINSQMANLRNVNMIKSENIVTQVTKNLMQDLNKSAGEVLKYTLKEDIANDLKGLENRIANIEEQFNSLMEAAKKTTKKE